MMERRDDLHLHSRYDPAGEAARYLDRILGDRRPSCLLILGGAEDWLSVAAKERFPASRVVSVQYDPAWRGRERGQADCRWYPDEDLGLDIFLHRNVSGAVDGGVAVVPWKPSEKAFPDSAERVLHTVRAVLEEITSDSATLRYWSFRWARNALRTFAETASYVSASRCGLPIVIAAAGPSLEISLRFLSRHRDKFHLWALSSAVGACLAHGCPPDLLISTDAGLWSDRHFDAFLRKRPGPGVPLAAPLTARVPARIRESCPLLLLSQGHPLETDLASAAALSFHATSPRGTAAADAISLALSSTTESVILAGLDMASLDFRSHCRPHGFDSIVRKRERRLRPFLTSLWERETSTFPLRFGAWRRGRSFDLYATGVAAGSAPRVYRLIPSPIDVPGTLPLEPDGLAPLLGSPAGSAGIPFARIPARNRTDRLRMARGVIQSWEEETDNILRASHDFVGLSARSRHLLYALGGTAAAGFLAEAARGRFDGTSAETARKAVHDATSKLRKIVE